MSAGAKSEMTTSKLRIERVVDESGGNEETSSLVAGEVEALADRPIDALEIGRGVVGAVGDGQLPGSGAGDDGGSGDRFEGEHGGGAAEPVGVADAQDAPSLTCQLDGERLLGGMVFGLDEADGERLGVPVR